MMLPRRLGQIVKEKPEVRLSIIGEGLELLGGHVESLSASIESLLGSGERAGAAALGVVCTEEAAKGLILLDMARDINSQKVLGSSAKNFYSHLPRAIYAAVHGANPTTYAEIVHDVARHRESHYLDGPNDADWVFRNELLRQRETALYVDYEENEPGKFGWTGGDPELVYVSHEITRLVLSMKAVGMLTETGARVTSEVWKKSVLDEATRWEYCRDKAMIVIRSVLSPDAEARQKFWPDIRRIAEKWTFPLTGLDLRVVNHLPDEMQEKGSAVFEQMMMDEYGPSAHDYR